MARKRLEMKMSTQNYFNVLQCAGLIRISHRWLWEDAPRSRGQGSCTRAGDSQELSQGGEHHGSYAGKKDGHP